MLKSKMKLVPCHSKLMDDRARDNPKEHSLVRMSRTGRSHFGVEAEMLEVRGGPKPIVLQVAQALFGDLDKSNPHKGNTTNIGWMTGKTYKMAISPGGGDTWLSENSESLIVGSDPEFGLIDDKGDFIYADKVVADDDKDKPFGSDGPCMELRPKQAPSVEEHLKNITALVKHGDSLKTLAKYRWWSGASFKSPNQPRKYTLGGHIHVGNPVALTNVLAEAAPLNAHIQEQNIHRRIIRVLDEMAGLPLTRIDGPDASYRRLHTPEKYGSFGDFRVQNGRFEWRAPSAIWLSSPAIALAVIGTVKAITEECYNKILSKKAASKWINAKVTTKESFLYSMRCVPDATVRDKLNNSTRNSISDAELGDIISRLKEMSTYAKNKSYIDDFLKLVSMSQADANALKFDKIRERWLGK